ncbi:choline-phosphate cytidylyltransferase A-like isoform X1 [Daphnia carinata]|uniref:choline-phosphate cytidylyltransferase A-like isoform X1 n=1 Tax=Daphnia carinata TaxID=120202 RepID=UPI002868710C|nr:choline-phosphate cytidylyltransferase A-like isoform X1 [Daphnia carinata]
MKLAPFSEDEQALEILKFCDYSIKISKEMAINGTAPRPIRVYTDGIYDLFHLGHARQLMQAKYQFPNVYLIVGVCSDKKTKENKGRTVMDENERYEVVRHCRHVDEVVPDAPWTLDDEFLDRHKIDFVAHDDAPYAASSNDDIYAHIKTKGMFVATQRTGQFQSKRLRSTVNYGINKSQPILLLDTVSTSDIVARIVKDYDVYARRNLARGYSAEQLNLNLIDQTKYLVEDELEKVKEKWNECLEYWKKKSKDFVGNFVTYHLETPNPLESKVPEEENKP